MNLPMIWTVARWEFLRFFKWKDVILTFVFMAVFPLMGGLVGWLAAGGGEPENVPIAVRGDSPWLADLPDSSAFVFRDAGQWADEDALRAALDSEQLAGVLTGRGADSARVLVVARPDWRDELRDLLDETRRRYELKTRGLTEEDLERLTAGVDTELDYVDPESKRRSQGELMLSTGLILAMLLGVWIGGALMFTGITGEKRDRVTEFVLSTITPQTWIDGKILGMAMVGTGYIAGFAAMGLVVILLGNQFAWFVFQLDFSLGLWDSLQVVILLLLGYLLWFAFIGAVSATVDDPQSSSKTVFIMFPMLAQGFAFLALDNPDTPALVVLSLIPFTSPAVIAARLALSTVPFWQFALAVLLLVGTIQLLRRYAGKVFEVGILMTGKEPSWKEIREWLKRA